MPSDGMPVKCSLDKPYQILLPSHGDWGMVPTHIGRKYSICDADGTKINKNTGAGLFCPDNGG